jgi:hypothetical protein
LLRGKFRTSTAIATEIDCAFYTNVSLPTVDFVFTTTGFSSSLVSDSRLR